MKDKVCRSDSKPTYEFTDKDYSQGTIGVREFGANSFTVDNISVQ